MLGLSLLSYSGLGIGDTFGLYSQAVKDRFNCTQGQIESIAMAGFWPNLIGTALIPGLVNDRFGGGVTMAGAAAFIFVGLFGFWATLVGDLPAARLACCYAPHCGPAMSYPQSC